MLEKILIVEELKSSFVEDMEGVSDKSQQDQTLKPLEELVLVFLSDAAVSRAASVCK